MRQSSGDLSYYYRPSIIIYNCFPRRNTERSTWITLRSLICQNNSAPHTLSADRGSRRSPSTHLHDPAGARFLVNKRRRDAAPVAARAVGRDNCIREMYNRACDIDGCNVWKCAEPLLSTKQNSIRFCRIQTVVATVVGQAVQIPQTKFE